MPRNTKRQVHWGGRDTLATQHKARKHTLQAALSSRCRLHVPPHHPPRPAQRLRRQPQLSAGRTDCRPAAAASRRPPSHGTPHCGPPALRPAEHTQPVAASPRVTGTAGKRHGAQQQRLGFGPAPIPSPLRAVNTQAVRLRAGETRQNHWSWRQRLAACKPGSSPGSDIGTLGLQQSSKP